MGSPTKRGPLQDVSQLHNVNRAPAQQVHDVKSETGERGRDALSGQEQALRANSEAQQDALRQPSSQQDQARRGREIDEIFRGSHQAHFDRSQANPNGAQVQPANPLSGAIVPTTAPVRECQMQDWPRHHIFCSRMMNHGPQAFNPPPPLPQSSYDHSQVGIGAIIGSSSADNYGLEDDDDLWGEEAFRWSVRDDDRDIDFIQFLANLPDIDVPPEGRKKKPGALTCKLMPHQRVGLTWLINQEESSAKGGILADTMGLGKTIQALALILARPSNDCAHKTTLIVAPLALLRQWEREIEDKVKFGHKLKTVIVHGQKKKSMTVAKLLSYDVVLTTYGTIASEHNPRKNSKNNKVLLSTRFHRIILDEAHNIKNEKSKSARAISSMRADYRLCMTGTPLMNNLTEVYSLIRFLRIPPYDEWRNFCRDFVKPIKGRSPSLKTRAMRALQALLRGILLQRTATSQIDGKQILQLPELESKVAVTEFDQDQREYYEALQHRLQLKFNRYVKEGTVQKNYSHILVLITRLRQCCCHPHLIKDHGIPEGADITSEEMVKLALKLDDQIVERIKQETEFKCPVCDDITTNPMIIYPCGHYVCGGCFSGLMQVGFTQAIARLDSQSICPTPLCRQEVDPTQVLLHTYFEEAHRSDASEPGSEEEDMEDSDLISESDDADEHGDLKDFIVSDDSEDLDEEDSQLEEEQVKEEDDTIPDLTVGEGRSGQDERERPTSSLKVSASQKEDDSADSDSDDSLPSLSEMWQRADKQKELAKREPTPNTPIRKTLPSKRTVKRNKGSPSTQVKTEGDLGIFSQSSDYFGRRIERSTSKAPRSNQSKTKAIKPEDTDDDMAASNTQGSKRRRISRTKSAASPVSTSRDHQGRADMHTKGGKRKRAGTKVEAKGEDKEKPRSIKLERAKRHKPQTLAELKQASLKNAAAKEKYFKRLRKDWETSAKIDKTMEILRRIRDENPREKTLIFSVFTSFLDLLEIPIDDEGYNYRRYDGSMSNPLREDAVEDFMTKPEVKVMLVSLRAGNAGLNLQAATQVIILEPFWNPYVEDQAIGRAHRLGQEKPVTVHRLVVEDTVEDRILDLQENKRKLVGEVLNSEAARGLSGLSINELAGLFGIGTGGRSGRRR
ncbi:uncharacterized protein JN550_010839 [Neoarthrinium moseri]|uniref:uncharacterized protein n=1 Tax=Neoarthrinium moseri TaxID=1658444 RepID=UPI001FDCAC35|nr:uncharacterized protein JN550_010839 [Neoarthrinium moseri]KAI1861459.1 hypothetical protein JN550_010839 [Neoarthrinium moseri]